MSRRFIFTSSHYLRHAATPVTAAGFSVSCWYRPLSLAANGTLFSIGDADVTNEQWRLGYNTLGRVRWSAQTSAGEAFATYTGAAMSVGFWYHCGGVEVSATSRLAYLDAASATNTTSRAPSGADSLFVGAKVSSTPADFANGDIAELALWDVALNSGEFARLANGVHPTRIRPEHLVAFWPLDKNTADFRGRLPFIPGTAPTFAENPPLRRRLWLPIWKAPSGGITVTPAAASAVAVTSNPTVVLGSLSLTPSQAAAVAATLDPTVILGAISIAPDPAVAIVTTVNPTVIAGGDLVVTPAPASAVATTVDPTTILGSLALTPTAVAAVGLTIDPTIVLGSVSVTPTQASAVVTTVAPAVVLGSLALTPTAVAAVGLTIDPTIVLGSVSVTPTQASAVVTTVAPAVVLGSTAVTPTPASAIGVTVDPTVATETFTGIIAYDLDARSFAYDLEDDRLAVELPTRSFAYELEALP